MEIIPERYLDLLQQKKAFASFATTMSDGSPQVTPVWFDYKDGIVRVNTAKGRVKARNLKEGAAVALAIIDRTIPTVTFSFVVSQARHGRGRRCAHRFARKEISRTG